MSHSCTSSKDGEHRKQQSNVIRGKVAFFSFTANGGTIMISLKYPYFTAVVKTSLTVKCFASSIEQHFVFTGQGFKTADEVAIFTIISLHSHFW